MKIAALYIIFAVIATAANLISQEAVSQAYGGSYSLYFSIFCGTLIGLVVKYCLDKKYIFQFQAQNKSKDAQAFLLYSGMGVITTLIFWGTEILFDMMYGTKFMRYLGAVLGLSIGYVVKYHLDKKYVFVQPAMAKV